MSEPTVGRIDAEQIGARLAVVRERIRSAAHAAGRDPRDVRIVAVSKFQPSSAVDAAITAGQRDFGENRAQELTAKRAHVADAARWHFVGRLQRNKVGQVVGHVVLVHSVDRASLVEAIARRARRLSVVQPVLVQVNVAGEASKGGCAPIDLPSLLAHIDASEGVAARGLMTIPPIDADAGAVFRELARLRAGLVDDLPELTELSMGMSGDLEAAVTHGATIVRVGTAIFGARPPQPAT
jgi:hypothetical protein